MFHFGHVIQLRQHPPVAHALSVASSRNPAKRVVVVAAVLGLEIAEVLASRDVITRGTRVFGLAKHGSSRQ